MIDCGQVSCTQKSILDKSSSFESFRIYLFGCIEEYSKSYIFIVSKSKYYQQRMYQIDITRSMLNSFL